MTQSPNQSCKTVSIKRQRLAKSLQIFNKIPLHILWPVVLLKPRPIQQEDSLFSCGNYKKASETCSSVPRSCNRNFGTFTKGQLQSWWQLWQLHCAAARPINWLQNTFEEESVFLLLFIKVMELEKDQLTKVEITDSLSSLHINTKVFLLLQLHR